MADNAERIEQTAASARARVRERTAALLKLNRVPLERWGTGEAKTLDHLVAELIDGECRLLLQDGSLTRHAEGAVVDVYCEGPGGRLKLVEDRQVFTDGRTKRRNLDTSIGEKMKPGEHPHDAATRALAEELGITASLSVEALGTRRKGPVPSVAFPGLTTVYDMHMFAVTLPPELVRPEGYVERQDDKTTYFVWQPADGA